MRSPCWDEDSISQTLDDGVTLHAIFLVQSLSQRTVQVPRLVMNGVVVRLQLIPTFYGHFIEQVPNLVSVPGMVDVPQRSWYFLLLPHSSAG